jgi:hypothetical protein
MSHFAQVINGIVTQVIVAEQDFINSGAVGPSSEWIQTSYNTRGGVHYAPNSNTPDNGVALRGNYAGIGHTYDSTHDVFYAPRPKDRNGISCDSWTISAPTWTWTAPTSQPISDTTPPTIYAWDEPTKTWVTVTPT